MLHYRAPSSRDAFKGSSKKKGKGDIRVLESNVYDEEVRGENQYENSFQGLQISSGKKGKLAIASDNMRPLDAPKLNKCLTSPRSTTVDGKSQKQKQKEKEKQKEKQKGKRKRKRKGKGKSKRKRKSKKKSKKKKEEEEEEEKEESE